MSALTVVRGLAASHGIEACGVCAFDTEKRPLLACRAAARLPENAQSVIVVLFPYRVDTDTPRNISRYACVPDYHHAAGAVLADFCRSLSAAFDGEVFEPFVDNSPLREVACAVAAGLGVKGDNGLLISDEFGSFVFIGCVVTTLSLPTSDVWRECIHCGACAAACPGDCLPTTSRDTCVSALTQKKGALTEDDTARIRRGGSLWGCDVCQDACPLNRDKRVAPHPCFTWYDPWLSPSSLDDLTDKAYGWRGKVVPLRNLGIFADDT